MAKHEPEEVAKVIFICGLILQVEGVRPNFYIMIYYILSIIQL